MIDWKISIGAVFGVLLSVLLAHLLTKRRDQEKSYKEEITKFKESFVSFLKELEDPNVNPALMVIENYPAQDESVRRLALKLPENKKKRFFKKWNRYTELYREKKSLGFAALVATEVDDLTRANFANLGAAEYIYEQTAIRRHQIIDIVSEALDLL
jgi:hypothetical protein